MIRMDEALEEAGLNARMLLQVHDELVFEVPDEEIDDTIPVIRRVMENAAEPAVELRVPLQGGRTGGAQLGRGALRRRRQAASARMAPTLPWDARR